ncbi:LysR family transcriptional regulator [Alginatibacterium sediminis]|uniref:LysR family transcriptional regulator n=1 Tax=Alginatibacterium sediminis TaxID=2164068 RepID=A0A420E8N8_9ALTE|nr:LysR substrate-binding domain-containing protein [Alginatibacterium sediminis]RKF15747.1 LysR family transcriptional regulator [Alginatibacterium sediminis]
MKERLPPLNSLYYFHWAAQLLSFSAAANELNVSAGAISQQIRQLEDRLQCRLFERQHRQVQLSEQGEILFRYTTSGFAALQDGVRQLNGDPDPSSLSLSVIPSFAQQWLVPRLGSFSQQHSELSVLLQSSNALVDFRKHRVDLCVRYGMGKYADLESHWLMDDFLYPVCHPIYQERHQIYKLEDLSKADLLEDARPDMNWNYWLELAGHDPQTIKPSLRYQGAHLVVQGALAVQGVALVRHNVAWKFIEEGTLVRIGDIDIRSAYRYFLCAPSSYFKRSKIRSFETWIQEQASLFWQQSLAKDAAQRRVIDAPEFDDSGS